MDAGLNAINNAIRDMSRRKKSGALAMSFKAGKVVKVSQLLLLDGMKAENTTIYEAKGMEAR